MKYVNQSIKRKNRNVEGTTQDNTKGMSYKENKWKEIMLIAGVAAMSVAAYKSGMLKKPISAMIKKAGKTKGTIPGTLKGFKAWINSSGLDDISKELGRSNYKSFFRSQNYEKLGLKDLSKLSSQSGRKDIYKKIKTNFKTFLDPKRFDDTIDDLEALKLSVDINKHNIEDLADSEFFKKLAEIDKAIKSARKNDGVDAKMAEKMRSKMMADLIESSTLTVKEARKSYNRTGHRAMVLGDLVDFTPPDENGLRTLYLKSNKFEVSNDTLNNMIDKLNKGKFLNAKDEFTSILEHEDLLKLKIDSSLFIDRTGEISDLRHFKTLLKDASYSLAKDFQIPVIGINPFSIMGLHEVAKPKNNFAVLNKGTLQSSVKGKSGELGFLEETMFFSNGNVYSLDKEANISLKAKNMVIQKIEKGAKTGSREIEALRKMNNINKVDYHKYTEEDGMIRSFIGKAAETLDLGFDDIDNFDLEELGANNMLNPNYWISKATQKVKKTGFLNPHKGAVVQERIDLKDGKIFERTSKTYTEMFINKEINDFEDDIFIAIKDSIKLKDILDTYKNSDGINKNKETFGKSFEYLSQFFAGRNSMDNVTVRSTHSHFFFDRVASSLSVGGVGFSTDSLGSPAQIVKSLLLKRALPIYAGYNTFQYALYLSEGEADEKGNKENMLKPVARMAAGASLTYHKALDTFGISTFAKGLETALPGIDHITELPFVNSLKLSTTYEEQLEYYQTGMDKIRKSRYWDGGTTAFTGCLTPDSELITENGIEKVKDIDINNLLVSKDGLYHKIIAKKIREADQMIYKVNTNFESSNNLWLTGNHHLYVIKKHYCSHNCDTYCIPGKRNNKCIDCKYKYYPNYKPEWIPVEEINKDEYMVTTVVQKATNYNNEILISEILKDTDFVINENTIYTKLNNVKTNFDEKSYNELVEISKIKHKRGELLPKLKNISERTGLTVKQVRQKLDDIRKTSNYKYMYKSCGRIKNNSIKLNKEFGYLLGYYAAEGCADDKSIRFSFNTNEKEYINHTRKLFKDIFGVKSELRIKKNETSIIVNSVYLVELFNLLIPGKAINKDKRLSKLILDIANEDMMKGLLSGFIKGDGYQSKTKQRITISQSSYEILKNIQTILLRFKVLSSISNRIAKGGKVVNNKEFNIYTMMISGKDCKKLEENIIDNKIDEKYLNNPKRKSKATHSKIGFFINDDIVALNINSIEKKDYKGPVYDFEVKDEDSFVNGYIMHNSKIEGFRPNWYRRIMSDWEFSETKWGSREEYFDNAPFPTPTSLFAPLKHFFLDPYHYDQKHLDDRPYPVSKPLFQNIPFLGSVLAPTLGELLKPTKYLHPYAIDNKGINGNNESYAAPTTLLFNSDSINGLGTSLFSSEEDTEGLTMLPTAILTTGGNVTVKGISNGDIEGLSGQVNFGGKSLNKLTQTTDRIFPSSNNGELNPIHSKVTQNTIAYNSAQLYEDSGDFFGLYGFMGTTVTGKPLDDMSALENSSYAYSASRLWYDNKVGGLGGEVNEIARRFLRKRMDEDNLINPIRNNAANFLPGADYFTDFTRGDMYVKIASGELRLPGEAYERLWGISDYEMYNVNAENLYNVDKAVESIVNKHGKGGYSGRDRIIKEKIANSLSKGNTVSDITGQIDDYDLGVKGEFDAKFINPQGVESILLVKTVDDLSKITNEQKKRDKASANYSMYATETQKAYVQYVERNNEYNKITEELDYDADYTAKLKGNAIKAKKEIDKMIESGELNRGDLYSPVDKFRILGDVAPYSKEFDQMSSVLSSMDLTEEEREDVNAVRDRVSELRKPKRLYNYQFKGHDTKSEVKIVDAVIKKGVFTVVGDNTPYKLAGIELSNMELEAEQEKLDEVLDSMLKPGSVITVEYDSNSVERERGGKKRVIVHKDGENLNKLLLRQGLAKENKSDNALDMKVKTNAVQRAVGGLWERFAHLDTPFHSKFLRVRSAKEDYERSRVYGKEFSDWKRPIKDYLRPYAIDRNIGRNFISGTIMGVVVGSMFGRSNNKYAKVVGAVIGGGTILAGKFFAKAYENSTGTTWRPKRVRKEQELEDYIDKLKYVKYRSLYHSYAEKAKKEGINIDKYINASKSLGKKVKYNEKKLNDFEVKAIKLKNALGIPYGVTRTIKNITGLNLGNISIDFSNNYMGFGDKLSKTKNTIIANMRGKARERYLDKSNLIRDNIKLESLGDKLKNIWGNGIFEMEDAVNQKAFISEQKKFLKGQKIIAPLRRGKSKTITKRLQNLLNIQATLSNVGQTFIDENIEKELKKVGVRPTYIRRGRNRHIDKEKTIFTLQNEISKEAQKQGFSVNATKALEYYKMSEKTMYAYDQGDSVSDLMAALPKRDRDYFREFSEATDEEKLEILDLVPKYMRRPLEATWGLEVEKKDNLLEYFKTHPLPNRRWIGWDENADLNDVKVKMVKNEGLEFSDMNVWEDDVKKANATEMNIPVLNYKTDPGNARKTLIGLFGRQGMSDISYNLRPSFTDNDISLYIKNEEKNLYASQLKGQLIKNL